ncbi:MAG TPA: TIGR02281 family clan AA aspartic protease [Sphingomicrobium sp.]|nr:TIGR02281 family clan AA aspartic protease [Sphingomicrobium sp.]
MLRTYLIVIVLAGIAASLLGQVTRSRSPSREVIMTRPAVASAKDQSDSPGEPNVNRLDGSIQLDRNADGHFYADVRINGTVVHMLVDTGASSIALSRDDARMAGLATSIGMNEVVGEGADGAVHGEYVRLDRVELGPLSTEGLDAVVLSSGQQSLLGQSFLSKFKTVQIEGDRMVLR